MMKETIAQVFSLMKAQLLAAEKTRMSNIGDILTSREVFSSHDVIHKKDPHLIVVFLDSLSVVYDVVRYQEEYVRKYRAYKKVLLLDGLSSSKYVSFTTPLTVWAKDILRSSGIPEEVIFKQSQATPLEELRMFLKHAHYKHVLVFSARGYGVSTALELKRAFSDMDFRFFEPEYTGIAPFEMDSIEPVRMGVDLLLGQLVRLHLFGKLPKGMKYRMMPLSVIRKYTDKGYILGLNSPRERAAVGISEEKFFEMLPKRLEDIHWINDPDEYIRKVTQQ